MIQMRLLHRALRRFLLAAAFASGVGHLAPAWAQGPIFVANYSADSITVYPRLATGDVLPLQTILGQPNDGPHQIAINHSGNELIVADNIPYAVTIYDLATGLVKRKISGSSTRLVRPTGVAVDEVNSEIYVANDYANSITVYDLMANGDVPPKREIVSSSLSDPVGVAVDY